jgi:hypothetical protein
MSKSAENWKLSIYPKNLDISKSWFIQLDYTDPETGKNFGIGIEMVLTTTKQKQNAFEKLRDL